MLRVDDLAVFTQRSETLTSIALQTRDSKIQAALAAADIVDDALPVIGLVGGRFWRGNRDVALAEVWTPPTAQFPGFLNSYADGQSLQDNRFDWTSGTFKLATADFTSDGFDDIFFYG